MKRFLKHFFAMTLAAALCVGIAPWPRAAESVVTSQTVKPTPGDVNGDGAVNTKDVTALRRYLAGGYDVTAAQTAADANGDGAVNTKDVTALRRYLAGGYGVKLGKQTSNFDENSTPMIPAP